MRPLTVLISSAGRRAELLRIFRDVVSDMAPGSRVLATDSSWYSSAFHLADEGFIVPRVTDPELVPQLLALCEKHAVDVVVPTTDREMPVWVGNRERFEAAGTRVALSAAEVIAIAADKQATQDWLTGHGFPTVRQASPAAALADPAAWPFPLMAKPRFGSASEGVGLVRNRDELELVAVRDAARPPMSDGTRGDMVVQSVAGGEEHTIDVFVGSDGRCRCAVPRRRLEVRGGEVSKAVTVRSAELIDLAHDLCHALPGPYGVLNFQVFADEETGQLAVIELNPRFGGGFPLSYQAGADYPRWLLEDVRGLPSGARPDGWREGLVMLRYDAAVFVDRAQAPA
ncbi:MAG TPA: ATP-grasp domain-containing protein [Acidimicrobiales bacterium]